MKKVRIVSLMFLLISCISVISYAQSPSKIEQEVLQLSKDKWEWMANKDVVKLGELFDAKAKFVHMSGSWKTDRELEIIESGSIWYKEAIVHDSAVEVSKKTAIVWNRITLVAHVRGNDVSNEFTVTEVYQKKHGEWEMLGLTFSSVRDTHQIQK
ncbi:nuclear transport factor 2 family protein [uncultured Arcticibacterium sp.]|uniref:nuclear transport factor 2 family protein n=1 Tax=uncultured Arcticibacterium sp. TaxID=2173042 RepID=UPI0030F915A9